MGAGRGVCVCVVVRRGVVPRGANASCSIVAIIKNRLMGGNLGYERSCDTANSIISQWLLSLLGS